MIKTKRIAVCLSGHLRSIEAGYENFYEKVIQANPEYEFDFFISTWNSREWRDSHDLKVKPGQPLAEIISKVFELYKPVRFLSEDEMDWDTSYAHPYIKKGDVKKNTKGEHIPAMFYKIMSSFNLAHAYDLDDYDLVMRHRTDIGFKEKIDLSAHEGSLVLSKNMSNQPGWYSDVSAYGPAPEMMFYCRLYDSLQEVVENSKYLGPRLYFTLI